MGMCGSRAVTLLVLISDDVINRIQKLDIQTNILVYVTRCCTDLTSKVLKERTFGQSSAVLFMLSVDLFFKLLKNVFQEHYQSVKQDPDQARNSTRPDLGPNCLQRLSLIRRP